MSFTDPTYKIVIARYEEDISLARLMRHPYIRDFSVILNKGEPLDFDHPEVVSLPNEPIFGRESDSYLHYIINNYDNLPDYVIFTQADPFDHSPGFVDITRILLKDKTVSLKSFQPLTWCWKESHGVPPVHHAIYNNTLNIVDKKAWLATGEYQEYRIHMDTLDDSFRNMKYTDQAAEMIMYNFRKFHEIKNRADTLKYIYNILKIKKPYVGYVLFNYGAIFGVSKKNILSNDLSYYIMLRDFVNQHITHGYIMERMWFSVLGY
jgi:hypothetical protein